MALVRSHSAICDGTELCVAHGVCARCCPKCQPGEQCELPLEFIEDPDERGVYIWDLGEEDAAD